MKKCIIYPFFDEYYTSINYIESQNKVKVSKLVKPKGWNLSESDNLNLECYDFLESLKAGEIVIILNTKNNSFMHTEIVKNIILALNNRKEVKCFEKLSKNELNRIKNIAVMNETIFTYHFKNSIHVSTRFDLMYKPKAIVIGVGKLLNNLNALSVMCDLANEYKKNGFFTMVLSNNVNADLFGFIKIPTKLSVEGFNKFIEKVERKYHPEILIIEFPDAIMRYSDYINNDFGIYSYIITQAISIDYFVLLSCMNQFSMELFEELNLLSTYRFNCEINNILLEDYILDEEDSNEFYKIVTRKISSHDLAVQIDAIHEKVGLGIIKMNSQDAISKIVKRSIDLLSLEVDSF